MRPQELADYMSSIPETTYFVFAEKEIDKKTKMYKQVKKNGSIVEFPRQNETTLSRWIEGRIRRNGKNITRDAYALFIRKTGDGIWSMPSEACDKAAKTPCLLFDPSKKWKDGGVAQCSDDCKTLSIGTCVEAEAECGDGNTESCYLQEYH